MADYAALAEREDARHGLGGNSPPGPIDDAQVQAERLNAWLADNPVVDTAHTANAGARLVKDARIVLDAVEAERVGKVKPLNDAVKLINGRYNSTRDFLTRIIDELRGRLTAFATAEEARRYREAQGRRVAANEAELVARERDDAALEAIDNAKQGEIGVDVAAVTAAADEAYAVAAQAARDAARAERDVPVRLAGDGFGRALSMRNAELLHLDDPVAALEEIGITNRIRDAFLKEARAYRKEHGKLPAGVRATTERALV